MSRFYRILKQGEGGGENRDERVEGGGENRDERVEGRGENRDERLSLIHI